MDLKKIMNRITVIKDFLSKNECEYALKECNYSIIQSKLKEYITNTIELKGYIFNEISPFKINTHITNDSSLIWKVDTTSYISFLIQLNDSYNGGYFQFLVDNNDRYFQLHHGIGHMVVFFSNIQHRTSPIESGTKYTLSTSVSIVKDINYDITLI